MSFGKPKKISQTVDTVILYHISTSDQIVTTDSITASQHRHTASDQQAPKQEALNEKGPEEPKKRKPVRFILGVEAWKRQGQILKHRASFPLLRQVLRSEREQSESVVPLRKISTKVLQRSLLSHLFILAFTVPAALWAAYTMTKGLAAGIRFDTWFNAWLLQGIPLFIFCAMKSLTSNHSRGLIQAELASRDLSQTTPEGE